MTCEKSKILVICFSNLKRDPRPFRQLQFLKEDYAVCAVGRGDPEIEGVEYFHTVPDVHMHWNSFARKLYRLAHISETIRSQFPLLEMRYWTPEKVKNYQQLAQRSWDLVIANELSALPLAIAIAKKSRAKVLFDAHEYEPGLVDSSWKSWLFKQRRVNSMLRRCLPRVDTMVTVCDIIAKEYEKNFGKKCSVITNAPFYEELQPTPVKETQISLIHHGGTNPSRSLHNMILLMDKLDERFSLDLMLVPKPSTSSPSYRKILDFAKRSSRVHLHKPPAMTEIAASISKYDIGVYLLPPSSFNQYMALPNKLFEFIQARLAVAIWPSPEMARIVNKYECGVVADDFTLEAMAEKLNCLTREEVMRFKENSHKAARLLCAETNQKLFLRVIRGLLGERI